MSDLVQRKAKGFFSVEIEDDGKKLTAAAREGRITIIVGLLSTNMVDINMWFDIGWEEDSEEEEYHTTTPLYEAARNDHTDIVRLLLDKGAKPNIPDEYGEAEGESPLKTAARNGHKDVVKLLIDRGADPNMFNEHKEDTALHDAARMGHNDVIQMLLDIGADPNIVNLDGDTPLHNAAKHGHIDVVQKLLNIGSDPNIANDYGNTPLYLSVRFGHKNIVVLLLSKDANPNPHKKHWYEEESPLTAALDGGKSDLAQILLDAGAEPNEEDQEKMERLGCFTYFDF